MLKLGRKTKDINMFLFKHRILALAVLFTLLSACTTVTPPSPPATQIPWKNRELALNRIMGWEISGKIAVQTAKDSGSANVDWMQNHGQYTVSLYGPLGAGGLKLIGHPGMVTMEASNGKRVTAKSPEQLLAQQWGWNLPVSSLSYWIRGLPVPGVPYSGHFDGYNRLSSLVQQGWNVQFLSYRNYGTVDLPDKLTIDSSTLRSKIVIHQWKIEG